MWDQNNPFGDPSTVRDRLMVVIVSIMAIAGGAALIWAFSMPALPVLP